MTEMCFSLQFVFNWVLEFPFQPSIHVSVRQRDDIDERVREISEREDEIDRERDEAAEFE
ncbi:hypothetical protein L195_g061103 [Trifolium pratense]|uniref:Uncharacterized protein n=3 Tax=Trifolium pratense TaxID=57577 RepID=A0A2K3K7U9_TRIPR|nr:hypothetical protein L195_g061103 [Trifolium pratense]